MVTQSLFTLVSSHNTLCTLYPPFFYGPWNLTVFREACDQLFWVEPGAFYDTVIPETVSALWGPVPLGKKIVHSIYCRFTQSINQPTGTPKRTGPSTTLA